MPLVGTRITSFFHANILLKDHQLVRNWCLLLALLPIGWIWLKNFMFLDLFNYLAK
jgi:hypothetical protein